MRQVAITGMGAACATGLGVERLWTACRDGIPALGPVEMTRPCKLRVDRAGQVRDFDPLQHIAPAMMSRCDRFTQLAHVAAREAVAQSGLSAEELAGTRTAVIIGTGVGGFTSLDQGHYQHYVENRRADPMGIPRQMPSAASSFVSMTYGATGPCFAVTSACASATQSIGIGAMLVRSGVVDRAIVGGSEAAITPVAMRSWESMRVVTSDQCRPFSKGRSGMIVGEGAGVLVIEALEAVRARGGMPLALLAGYGTSSDARDFIQPDVAGATAAIRSALADAQLDPASIGYINAHGTATVLNDVNEAAALRNVFGAALDAIPVSSSKPIFGHGLGAAGGLELIVTVKALVEQTVPPQINFLEPDPACPLNLPTQGAFPREIGAALSNSFAFGGINAVLVVTRADL
ncbi:MAG TPA: beta-ketoacyl-[acyl-carrier-protein] synthase family protein [Beijerinckiaceae bacterium]|nr:beta-ketoacyl-[acyl-carrier-protein] synthase family protein [Beijerinckiaceae bacterium]